MDGTMETKVEGKFLIASHKDTGYRVYSGRIDGETEEVVIPPGIEVAVSDGWEKVPAFARDQQKGLVSLRRSDTVPEARGPEVDPKYSLDAHQAALATMIVYSATITPELKNAVRVHELLGPGGMTPNGVKVTKQYVMTVHSNMLRAALDLEHRTRKRKDRIRMLETTLKDIEAL